MSVESAKAFCVRMMSDEDFRNGLGCATDAAAIAAVVKQEKYDFSKEDLLKVVGELMGKKIAMSDFKKMICDVYEEEINTDGKGSTEAVAAWLDSLA